MCPCCLRVLPHTSAYWHMRRALEKVLPHSSTYYDCYDTEISRSDWARLGEILQQVGPSDLVENPQGTAASSEGSGGGGGGGSAGAGAGGQQRLSYMQSVYHMRKILWRLEPLDRSALVLGEACGRNVGKHKCDAPPLTRTEEQGLADLCEYFRTYFGCAAGAGAVEVSMRHSMHGLGGAHGGGGSSIRSINQPTPGAHGSVVASCTPASRAGSQHRHVGGSMGMGMDLGMGMSWSPAAGSGSLGSQHQRRQDGPPAAGLAPRSYVGFFPAASAMQGGLKQ